MKTYGLIGKSLKHSFSKRYFTEKFEKEKIKSVYELFEIEKIEKVQEIFQKENLNGLNVTIPYKEVIIPYLDEVDETAKVVGAVNTIKFIRHSAGTLSLKGYNTDVLGFSQSIRPHLKAWHKKALILGTGGVAKAIDYSLKSLGIETKFVSRTPSSTQLSYEDLNSSIINDFLLIVNGSPIGMFPNITQCPKIPYVLLGKKHLLFDAIYNPIKTLFLQKGEKQGAEIINGLEMLVNQAEESWKIWNK
ncbi:MAG: shikimate dehydrogenase [Paludibacter sp.]|nr:MAG: shikimate dehydrogenase [Paludibacter sp.]